MSSRLLNPEKPISNEWANLVPLDTPNLPGLETGCLPGWAGDFAGALAEHTESPRELAVGMVLVSLAAASARRLKVEVGPGYHEPCNLWTVVALAPGNRKSAVQSAATAPLVEWERAKIIELEPEIKRLTSEYETLKARAKEKRAKSVKENDERKARELAQAAADNRSFHWLRRSARSKGHNIKGEQRKLLTGELPTVTRGRPIAIGLDRFGIFADPVSISATAES